MSDEDLRALERGALEGDPEAEERFYRELERRGELRRFDDQVEAALAKVQGERQGHRTATITGSRPDTYAPSWIEVADPSRLAPFDVVLALERAESGVVARSCPAQSTFVAIVTDGDDHAFAIGRGEPGQIQELDERVRRDREAALAGLETRHVSRAWTHGWLRWARGPEGLSLTQKTLDGLGELAAHVRRRHRVYVGDAPFMYAVEALVGLALDSGASRVVVERASELRFSVADDGEGVPFVEEPPLARPRLEALFGRNRLDSLLGMVTPLFRMTEVETVWQGRSFRQRFERGIPLHNVQETPSNEANGTRVHVELDPEISWGEASFSALSGRLFELAAMHAARSIRFNDVVSDKSVEHRCEDGLLDLLVRRAGVDPAAVERATNTCWIGSDVEVLVEVALALRDGPEPLVIAFANGRPHGGVHVHAVLSASREELADDVRDVVAAVSVRLRHLHDAVPGPGPHGDVESREVVGAVADLTRGLLDRLPR